MYMYICSPQPPLLMHPSSVAQRTLEGEQMTLQYNLYICTTKAWHFYFKKKKKKHPKNLGKCTAARQPG